MKRPLRIVITTGDTDGIGFEIASKALVRVGPKPNITFYIWRAPKANARDLKRIDSKFKRVTVSSWPEALEKTPSSNKEIVDIASRMAPAHWVEHTAQAGTFGHIDALATAPLSKTSIVASGLKDRGHTEILKRVSGEKHVYMTFIGDKFSVLSLTGHIPINKVSSQITVESLENGIKQAHLVKAWLGSSKANKPLALIGLNPHAGEEGLIGNEEQNIFIKTLSALKKEGIEVEGPLVPDVAFQPQHWKKYSIYVCPYHDQALIPFKMTHKYSGVHLTMGLPFIRTSVDHGTAKDIFGKNKADYSSMVMAIDWAISLAKLKSERS